MQRVRTYRDLEAWQLAMNLAEVCYGLSKSFPRDELFGLTAQLRRAAVSIATNIAEGHSRRTRPAYAHHVSIALGSQAEVETILELAIRLRLAPVDLLERIFGQARVVGKLLYGLHRALELANVR
jgi:four helix bundle protein